MDAKSKAFSFLSNEGIVKIPFFQRPYVWEETNWSDLFEELINFRKNHFFGSLILKQQPARSGEPKEVLVIDGQQRLTTLSLLVKALFDSFAKDVRDNCEASLRANLFFKRYQTDKDYHIKITHSKVDFESYELVLRSKLDNLIPTPSGGSNKIVQCYNYFKEKLSHESEDARKRLYNSILDNENKMLVVIDLINEDDEQSIFDTINSAGVRLSGADIIKNALFQRIIELHGDLKKAISIYEATWEKTFLADAETIDYWATERLTGRFKRDNIELLLHAIAVIKGFFDPDLHTLSDLPELYKKKFNEFTHANDIVEFAKEISEYGSTYRARIITFETNTLLTFADAHSRLLHILDMAQISTFHPFILLICKSYKSDHAKQQSILKDLERYIVRRIISNAETKSYNKICKEFILAPDSINIKLESDDKVTDGLKNIANKNASIILFWIELYRRSKDNKQGIKELVYNYSLEHIMPQQWQEHWTDIPAKTRSDGTPMTEEESIEDRFSKVYWIGNMTLLTSSLNSSLRNFTYAVKMIGEGRKKGTSAYADLSITKHDLVLPFEAGDRVWDEQRISQRTLNLTEEIFQIW
jgi:hypothetical protein